MLAVGVPLAGAKDAWFRGVSNLETADVDSNCGRDEGDAGNVFACSEWVGDDDNVRRGRRARPPSSAYR